MRVPLAVVCHCLVVLGAALIRHVHTELNETPEAAPTSYEFVPEPAGPVEGPDLEEPEDGRGLEEPVEGPGPEDPDIDHSPQCAYYPYSSGPGSYIDHNFMSQSETAERDIYNVTDEEGAKQAKQANCNVLIHVKTKEGIQVSTGTLVEYVSGNANVETGFVLADSAACFDYEASAFSLLIGATQLDRPSNEFGVNPVGNGKGATVDKVHIVYIDIAIPANKPIGKAPGACLLQVTLKDGQFNNEDMCQIASPASLGQGIGDTVRTYGWGSLSHGVPAQMLHGYDAKIVECPPVYNATWETPDKAHAHAPKYICVQNPDYGASLHKGDDGGPLLNYNNDVIGYAETLMDSDDCNPGLFMSVVSEPLFHALQAIIYPS